MLTARSPTTTTTPEKQLDVVTYPNEVNTNYNDHPAVSATHIELLDEVP
jgi:hypothetical protein